MIRLSLQINGGFKLKERRRPTADKWRFQLKRKEEGLPFDKIIVTAGKWRLQIEIGFSYRKKKLSLLHI